MATSSAHLFASLSRSAGARYAKLATRAGAFAPSPAGEEDEGERC